MAVRRVVLDVGGGSDRAHETDGRMGGTAVGTVEWLNGHPQEITWREQGRWTEGPLAGTRFSSAYAWHRRPDGIVSIAHTRSGIDRPVALVDLIEAAPGTWRSARPHLCGEDEYAAGLVIAGPVVVVTWTVTGPTTDYVLSAHYSPT